jgi:hypothetical protein
VESFGRDISNTGERTTMSKRSRAVRELEQLLAKTKKAVEQAKKQKVKWSPENGGPKPETVDESADKDFKEAKKLPFQE